MFRVITVSLIYLVTATLSGAQTPAQIELHVADHLKKLAAASNYSGTGDYDALERENKALRETLVRFGNRPDVLKYSFAKVNDDMFITTSKDGRFRTYSWDSESGGTMHDYLTVYQFLDSRGKVHTLASTHNSEEGGGAFVHDIFQTETNGGPIYLAVSTFIGSTSLAAQTIAAFKIRGSSLDMKPKVIRTSTGPTDSISFEYDFFSVVDHPERPIKLIKYDAASKTFTFPVVIEDENALQGRVTDKRIAYRFDGHYFVKVR